MADLSELDHWDDFCDEKTEEKTVLQVITEKNNSTAKLQSLN